MNRWTPERKQKQAALIKTWKPWEKSSGAKTPEGKKRSSQNALKHGGRTAEIIELRKKYLAIMKERHQFIKQVTETIHETRNTR